MSQQSSPKRETPRERERERDTHTKCDTTVTNIRTMKGGEVAMSQQSRLQRETPRERERETHTQIITQC
jgi:hypothetical protein